MNHVWGDGDFGQRHAGRAHARRGGGGQHGECGDDTRTASGGPYHRQEVVFAANQGDANFMESMNAAAGGADSEASSSAALLPLLAPLTSLSQMGSGQVAPGVHIAGVVEDSAPPLKRFDPGNPDAGADGYVAYPDINPLTEMVDLMGATRAYGLNSSAVQAEKGMITSALEIAKS
jgi:flagellar basal-body rod protein FlgC